MIYTCYTNDIHMSYNDIQILYNDLMIVLSKSLEQ